MNEVKRGRGREGDTGIWRIEGKTEVNRARV